MHTYMQGCDGWVSPGAGVGLSASCGGSGCYLYLYFRRGAKLGRLCSVSNVDTRCRLRGLNGIRIAGYGASMMTYISI